MPSLESTLRKVFVVVVIVVIGVIVYLLLVQSQPSVATITPSSTAIDVGQSVFVGVQWKGGSAPYTVDLYSVASGDCNSTALNIGEKSGLTQPQYVFTISPSESAHYCGLVSTSGSSSAISRSVLITVNPALGNPSLTFTPPALDTGQTGNIIATVDIAGGSSPYIVTLYSGSASTCASDTTVVGVNTGKNPVTQLVGTQARFSFSAPNAATYYCASLKDSTPATPTTSSAEKFAINTALAASITPGSPKLDAGQSLILTAVAAQGTPPYTYQWHLGSSCTSPIAGQNSSTYSTGTLTSTGTFSVLVGDSSTGTPAAAVCAKTTVAYGPTFTGTPVTIGPSLTLDAGQLASLTVSWQPAGNPPYTVRLTSSSTGACANAVPAGPNMTKVTSTTVEFQVTPTTSTSYCATVSDSATTQESTFTAAAATVTVNPALSGGVNLSPSAVDSGQSASITAIVSTSGGTPSYSVTLRSGSSSSCISDTTIVAVSGLNPQVGIPGPTASFNFPAPGSSTYYCAELADHATTPNTVLTTTVQFGVNPTLSASINPPAPSVVAGNSITLNAVPSGGTAPFTYQWFMNAGCKIGSAIAGQTTSSYSTGTLAKAGAYQYSVLISDSNVGKPVETACASATVTVTPALFPVISLSPPGLDQGQTATVVANVSWSGGTSPFTVTLNSGSSPTCSVDTTLVAVSPGPNPRSGLTGKFTTFSFSSPTASTYYCAVVKDSASTPSTVSTQVVLFAINPVLSKVNVVISPTALDAGQSATIAATVSWTGGTAPYTVTLYSGSSATCSSNTIVVPSPPNPKTMVLTTSTSFSFSSPGSSTYYCAVVGDSGFPVESVPSSAQLLLIAGVLTVSPPILSPVVIDAGQSTSVTATVTWTGGASPFIVTMFIGSSSSCQSDTTMLIALTSNPVTGVTGSTASITFASPAASMYYCASVKDTSATPVTALSGTTAFTVDPALAVSLAPMSPPAIDLGQSATVTATVSWTGGTSPYTVALFTGLSASCASDTTPVGTPKTGLITTSSTISFSSPSSTAFFCAKVTDSSAIPLTLVTSSVRFTVNSPPTASLAPPAPSIGSGQTAPTLSATGSGGTPPYTYQWYTGLTCTSAISGQTQSSYLPGVLTVTSTYSVKVTDSSPGTPASLSTACAGATIAVGSGPEGVASDQLTGFIYVADPLSNHISVIDTFSNSVVATIPVGTLPWGVAIDAVDNLIYVTNYGSGTVSIIDGFTNSLCVPTRCALNTITVGSNPEGIALNLVLSQAYVANSGSNTVSVINITSDTVFATVPVGSSPQSVAVGSAQPKPPNSQPYTVFVTNYGSNTISVIPVGSPYLTFPVTTVTVGNNPWGVVVNPSTNRVYVTNSGSGTVTVLNGSSFSTISTISLGPGSTPEGIDIDTSSSKAYVANPASNTVSVIDLTTNTVSSFTNPPIPMPVGIGPWGVATVIPSLNVLYPSLAYVTNSGTNTVSVIDLATNEVITAIVVS